MNIPELIQYCEESIKDINLNMESYQVDPEQVTAFINRKEHIKFMIHVLNGFDFAQYRPFDSVGEKYAIKDSVERIWEYQTFLNNVKKKSNSASSIIDNILKTEGEKEWFVNIENRLQMIRYEIDLLIKLCD